MRFLGKAPSLHALGLFGSYEFLMLMPIKSVAVAPISYDVLFVATAEDAVDGIYHHVQVQADQRLPLRRL